MENERILAYLDRVYGYCIRHTFSREEADELSQEILYTALKRLPTLADQTRFEPWLWAIAGNVTKAFKRKQGRARAMYCYGSLEDVAVHYDEYPSVDKESYGRLRAKIAGLSQLYRDILVLHYYDGMSVKQISEKLAVPEGTVTWRLSEGRKKLKKECINMQESALKPVRLNIQISGNGNYNGADRPFPWVYINDALSQNILYYCYKAPQSVEELSKRCGVPAFFIEDTVKRLLYREALGEPAQGKYRTDFIIYDQTHAEYNKQAAALAGDIAEEMVGLLKKLTEVTRKSSAAYIADRTVGELCVLYGVLALEHLNKEYNPFPFVPYRVKCDGGDWAYHGFAAGPCGFMGSEKSLNLGSEGTYAHYSYHFAGFTYRPMMYDFQINICEKLMDGSALTEKEKECTVSMMEKEYISNKNGEITVCIPSFTLAQKNSFDALTDMYFADFMPKYVDFINRYADGYRRLFPKHLKEEVDRVLHRLFIELFAVASAAAQKKGLLEKPDQNRFCDVLVQFR